MSTIPECPAKEQLRHWLTQDETDPAIESHIETCSKCQARLEALHQPMSMPSGNGASVFANREADARFLADLCNRPQVSPTTHSSSLNSTPTPSDTLPTFPGYTVSGILGRGGMGVVYAATQTGLNRVVAVKTIHFDPGVGAKEISRFRLEAEAAARLQHPNVVQVHEVGEQAGTPFLALEFLEGGCLADYLKQSTLTDQQAAHLVQILARAVQHAHQRGIIHRDLKPANVLLQWCPEHQNSADAESLGEVGLLLPGPKGVVEYCVPKITDFGLAKFIQGHQVDTLPGSILGTPSYMAPEQARGRTIDLSTAVDVYALGAILYELLTGYPPFHGQTLGETLYQVVNDPPPRPTQIRATIAPDLEAICLKCLEKEPRNRYATAKDLAEDLHRFEADEPVLARQISHWLRLRKFARRNPTATALGSLIALTTLAVIIATIWYQSWLENWLQQVSTERDIARDARKEAEAKKTEAEQQRDRAQENLYLAQIPLAQRAWNAAHLERMTGILNGHIPDLPTQKDLRNIEWHYLNNLAHAELKTFTGHTGLVTAVAYHPNGKQLASGSADGSIRIWDVNTGRELLPPLRKHTDRVTSVVFDTDGQLMISTGADRAVHLWNIQTGEHIRSFPGHTDWVYHAAISTDGKRLATASADRTIRLWSMETGEETQQFTGHTKQVTSVSFSPDQQSLASSGADKTIRLWNLKTPREPKVFKGHGGWVYSVLFSPDGQTLASCSFDESIRLWDIATGQEKLSLTGHTGQVRGLAFNREGTRLVSASYDQTVRVWDSITGEQLVSLKGHLGKVHTVAFHPDGKSVASGGADHSVKIWDVTRPQDYEPLAVNGTKSINAMAIRNDNQLLAVGTQDGSVRLRDLGAGRWFKPIPGTGRAIYSLAFSPDRRWLAIGTADKSLIVWDLETSRVLHTLTGGTGRVSGIAFSPDSRKVASVSYDGHLRIWDISTGQKLHDVPAHTGRATGITFNKTGTLLATAGEDRLVKLWNPDTGKMTRELEEHFGWVFCLAFSADGSQFASGSEDGSIRLWDTQNWSLVRTLEGHAGRVSQLRFSPDGQRLLSTGHADNRAKVWELKQGHELLSLPHPGSVHALVIRPDAQGFATAGEFPEIRLWNCYPQR